MGPGDLPPPNAFIRRLFFSSLETPRSHRQSGFRWCCCWLLRQLERHCSPTAVRSCTLSTAIQTSDVAGRSALVLIIATDPAPQRRQLWRLRGKLHVGSQSAAGSSPRFEGPVLIPLDRGATATEIGAIRRRGCDRPRRIHRTIFAAQARRHQHSTAVPTCTGSPVNIARRLLQPRAEPHSDLGSAHSMSDARLFAPEERQSSER